MKGNSAERDKKSENYRALFPEPFVTVPEIAAGLRVSKMHVYRAITAGLIKNVISIGSGKGKMIRVPLSSALEYIEEQTGGVTHLYRAASEN